VIQEETSTLWVVIIPVIVKEKFHMNMCLILNGYRDRAVSISRLKSIRFFVWGII
jgi:hypothetical protein